MYYIVLFNDDETIFLSWFWLIIRVATLRHFVRLFNRNQPINFSFIYFDFFYFERAVNAL